MKKRALIYGNQKCFSKYLKCKFNREFTFDVCKDFKCLNGEFDTYSVIVFVIYTEDNLLDFFKIYGSGVPLVVCAFNNRIVEVLSDLDGIFLLDTSKIRSEILNQLHFYFQEAVPSIPLWNTTDYKKTSPGF